MKTRKMGFVQCREISKVKNLCAFFLLFHDNINKFLLHMFDKANLFPDIVYSSSIFEQTHIFHLFILLLLIHHSVLLLVL